MSINHFSSDLPETVWWSQPQYHHHHHHHHAMETPTKSGSGTTTASTTFWGNSPLHHHHRAAAASSGGLSSFNFDLNNEDEEETVERRDHQEIPKEAMFEKSLTPSDVGKLNRLVIPKQHAEKYFPLNAAGGNETGPEKGLLLSFEDELGKPWRFRYSYWNSSQSYVLTKGWSRFVKEKKLEAGDIVVFERHRLDGDRMFIAWRRRISALPAAHDSGGGSGSAAAVGGCSGGGGWTRVYFNTSGHNNNPYPDQQAHHNHHPRHGSGFPYQSDHYLHAGVGGGVLQHKPTGGGANSKRLRLFGVNMECHQDSPEEVVDSDHHHLNHHRLSTTPPEGSSTTSSHGQQEAYYPFQYYSPKAAYFNHQNHMNINFSRDANETR